MGLLTPRCLLPFLVALLLGTASDPVGFTSLRGLGIVSMQPFGFRQDFRVKLQQMLALDLFFAFGRRMVNFLQTFLQLFALLQ